MLPTLYIGDYLAVAKWPYGYSRYSFPFGFPNFEGRVFGGLPKRGDVVVFRHPGEDSDLIKRVIGIPGDTIAVRGGRLVLNGRLVARQPLPPAKIRVTANSPCRVIPPALPTIAVASGHPACLYTAYRETLPGGPGYTVLDQVQSGPADDFPETKVPAGHLFLMGDNFYGAFPEGLNSPRWKTQFEDMYPASAFPGPCWARGGICRRGCHRC